MMMKGKGKDLSGKKEGRETQEGNGSHKLPGAQ
jgi:hypothetical protein